MVSKTCVLCSSPNTLPLLAMRPSGTYFHCQVCDLRFLDPESRLSAEAEKARYLEHNNDIHDQDYQNFVAPLFREITRRLPASSEGLDFGAGTGPVLTELLRKESYRITLYDPYFWPDPEALSRTYDFVFACEVAEHLYSPGLELLRLRKLLRPNGFLALMTLFCGPEIDFDSWYYRRDPTHVTFFSPQTFRWIMTALGFRKLDLVNDRIAVLTL